MPAFCCFGGPAREAPLVDAGWSSPVARQAHNLKVVGSNPTPATIEKPAFLMGSRAFSRLAPVSRPRSGMSWDSLLTDGFGAACGYSCSKAMLKWAQRPDLK